MKTFLTRNKLKLLLIRVTIIIASTLLIIISGQNNQNTDKKYQPTDQITNKPDDSIINKTGKELTKDEFRSELNKLYPMAQPSLPVLELPHFNDKTLTGEQDIWLKYISDYVANIDKTKMIT